MSNLRAYSTPEIWEQLNQFRNPETGKLKGSKVNAFLKKNVDMSSLYAFITSMSKFGAVAERAAEIWLSRAETEHIEYKKALQAQGGGYDMHSRSPIVLQVLDNDINSPLASWLSWQAGFRHAYLERQIKPSYENLKPVEAVTEEISITGNSEPVPAEPAFDMSKAVERTPFHIKLDWSMGAAAIALNHLSPWCEVELFRVWAIVRHIDTWRDGVGDGKKRRNNVSKAELRDFLKAAGLYSRESFNRWLTDGVEAGYFRSVTKTHIFYTKTQYLTEMLMKCLPEEVLPDFAGNQAIGSRDVWIDIRGKIARFKGQLMGAWLAVREREETGVTISNAALADMWHVSVRTVQNWRRQAQIPTVPNRDHHGNPIANSYHAPEDTQKHTHTGQSRKLRQIVNREITLRGFSPDSMAEVWQAKQHKRYFTNRRNNRKPSAIDAMHKHAGKYGTRDYLYAHVGYAQNPLTKVEYGVWVRGQ